MAMKIASMKPHCSALEWQARVDLAACYRLVDLYGMSDMMANHISSHVPGEPGAFLINAYGLMYEEITASSLIKVNLAGDILAKPDFGAAAQGRSQADAPARGADDPQDRPGGQQVVDYGINRAGYVIHSAIHGARPEVACVIHTHAFGSMAVSALQCGLLPITQTAMRFLKIGYHDYQGVVLDDAEKASLLADLGEREALILRNHGALVVGRTVGEAFNWAHRLELACRTQLAAMATQSALVPVPPEVLEATWNNYQRGTRRPYGLMEWPALLRKLDRLDPGYAT
jgi:ribulose-5-phosphate 4-epimerase/fuculose-1-phosphate aldolase